MTIAKEINETWGNDKSRVFYNKDLEETVHTFRATVQNVECLILVANPRGDIIWRKIA